MNINKQIKLFVILGCLVMGCGTSKKSVLPASDPANLEGSWVLNYISGPRIAFDGLYPDKKPNIKFDTKQNMVSGNTSCNNFTGKLNVDGNKINFTGPMAMTKMMCGNGDGEQAFLTTLQKVNTWSVSHGDTLNFIMGDVAVMRFARVKPN
jgi:heat shock protein HslJ